MVDEFGITGTYMHFAFLSAFVGSALLVFIVMWRHGRLDFDESPKFQMMEEGEER